ncbi:MAG TPA: twin-arginine translocase TatA/TatE family subunit [Acidimicrobiales bacterium]|jgi:sec-independent protein translocase protein TatB
MFDLDPGKLLAIAVVAILILGPDKLPQAAHRVGAMWRSFDEFRHKMEAEVRGSIPDLPSTGELARLARSPAALLSHLGDLDSSTVTVPDADPPVSASVSLRAGPVPTSKRHTDAAAVSESPSLSSTLAVAPGDANLN